MNSGSTVKLDVGGKLFKVYRSLIEQYPDTLLAKALVLQNEEDNDNNEKVSDSSDTSIIFDRNGDRFGYILDFMRDGKVTLPPFTITKEALIEDFRFFGFHEIDPNVIHTNVPVTELLVQMKHYVSTNQSKLSEFAWEEKKNCETKLAYYCWTEYFNEGTCRTKKTLSVETFRERFGIHMCDRCDTREWETLWVGSYSECCKEFGVSYIELVIEYGIATIEWTMCEDTTKNLQNCKNNKKNTQN